MKGANAVNDVFLTILNMSLSASAVIAAVLLARLALRRSVSLENYPEGSAQYLACDVDGDNTVSSADARLILRASVGLEDATKWQKQN